MTVREKGRTSGVDRKVRRLPVTTSSDEADPGHTSTFVRAMDAMGSSPGSVTAAAPSMAAAEFIFAPVLSVPQNTAVAAAAASGAMRAAASEPLPGRRQAPLQQAGRAVARPSSGNVAGLAPVRGSASLQMPRPRSQARLTPPGDNHDEDLALALALQLQEQESMHSRRPLGMGGMAVPGLRGSGVGLDSDEALAFSLAQEEEDDMVAIAAAIAASERAFGGGQAGPDVDRMDYEQLLALGERIGQAERPDKPTPAQLARLPTHVVPPKGRPSGLDEEEDECPVCCDCYKPGDVLRTLPCLHVFHAKCIDQWLLGDMRGARECPCCNSRVEF
eukprot:TRINITY_DN44722_c0_g1_i1.p1 TRINITY_DN44722_c0_g1~~TRINITY_DN44722_c0_g1_i1.p1  ORF type:complete len:332 (+),score=55.63 TRINITY_DN44722_c0_g1_i1:133-1128(+)